MANRIPVKKRIVEFPKLSARDRRWCYRLVWCAAECIGFVSCADRTYIRTIASATPCCRASGRDAHNRRVFACSADFPETAYFCLAFQADQSDESSCANQARKGHGKST
jgi:hypothetical protein